MRKAVTKTDHPPELIAGAAGNQHRGIAWPHVRDMYHTQACPSVGLLLQRDVKTNKQTEAAQ